jgi:hypothetical protein
MQDFMIPAFETIQLAELCTRLRVPYRHARYVLEEGILPRGVDPAPDRGNHRQLTPSQAFWLGIVLKLKESGVRTSLAQEIANFAKKALRDLTQGFSWEPGFCPFDGRLNTEYVWYIDVGDLTVIRVVTNAESDGEELKELPWRRLGRDLEVASGAAPVVVLRLDIGQLAGLLRG